MYKVSVITPIYAVSDYIERCAESLFRQTLEEIQFIFVDDASPDDSVTRLEQTLEHFPNRKAHTIILHHPDHRSLPEARATGLAYAQAPFVAHCDSDDYVEPDMYERLYNTAVIKEADMVICDSVIHHNDGTQGISRGWRVSSKDPLRDFIYGRSRRTVWCRLTKTDISRKVEFSTDNYLEDWVQVAQLLAYCQNVTYLPEPLYHQVRNPKSITGDRRLEVVEENVRQCKANYAKVHDFLIEKGLAQERDFIVMKNYIRILYYPLLLHFRGRRSYLQTFPELNAQLLSCPYISRFYKFAHICILLGIFPLVYPIAQPLYRRYLAWRRSSVVSN